MYYIIFLQVTKHFIRCTANLNVLGQCDHCGGRRSRDHTELLVCDLELGVLWDEYGLVGDIVVCIVLKSLRT
jgi:hypothetical protein